MDFATLQAHLLAAQSRTRNPGGNRDHAFQVERNNFI